MAQADRCAFEERPREREDALASGGAEGIRQEHGVPLLPPVELRRVFVTPRGARRLIHQVR